MQKAFFSGQRVAAKFMLDQEVFQLLPPPLCQAIEKIKNQHNNPLPDTIAEEDELYQIILDQIEAMATRIEKWPCNTICIFLLMPKMGLEYLCKYPEDGFLWLFQGLKAVNQFHYERRKEELKTKIIAAYEQAMIKSVQAKTSAQCREVVKIVLGAALTTLTAYLGKRLVSWIKTKVTRSVDKSDARSIYFVFRECFPASVLRVIGEQELYKNEAAFTTGMAKILGLEEAEFAKGWLVKCYARTEYFLNKLVEAEDQIKILKDFFSELNAVFAYGRAQDLLEEERLLFEAFSSIKKDAEVYHNPSLMEEIKSMLSEISLEVCKKTFE